MTTRSQETVTVAIPVYNGARFLPEALDSVARQTLSPTETLVFDNASTDETREIAAARLGPDAVRPTPVNKGAAWNFNRAVRESSGEYFAWLAADDRLRPGFVEAGVEALRASPDAVACLPAFVFITPDGDPAGSQRDPLLASSDPAVRLRSFLRRHRWTEAYCLYRRTSLLASPMFREEFGADVLLTWWFLIRGPFVVLDEPLVEYRRFPAKSLADMGESLMPGGRTENWRKLRMWRAMWRETASGEVDPRVRRVARRELVAALAGRHWMAHNVEDALVAIAGARGQRTWQRMRRLVADRQTP